MLEVATPSDIKLDLPQFIQNALCSIDFNIADPNKELAFDEVEVRFQNRKSAADKITPVQAKIDKINGKAANKTVHKVNKKMPLNI